MSTTERVGRAGGTTRPSRSVFDLSAFVALSRAMHPERRFPTAITRLKVGPLDREPDVATAWVHGAYARILGRLPDTEGLRINTAYLRNGGTPPSLVARMAASSEAGDTTPESDVEFDEVFVTGCYLVALGRRPDNSGLEVQRQSLAAGTSHEDLLRALLRSPEAESRIRFPPAPEAWDQTLARAVQEVVAGEVDTAVHHALVQAVRDGRSEVWLVKTALRLRRGRKALLATAPRWPLLAHSARRRAEHRVLVDTLENSSAWNWRVQRKLLGEIADLKQELEALSGRRSAE